MSKNEERRSRLVMVMGRPAVYEFIDDKREIVPDGDLRQYGIDPAFIPFMEGVGSIVHVMVHAVLEEECLQSYGTHAGILLDVENAEKLGWKELSTKEKEDE